MLSESQPTPSLSLPRPSLQKLYSKLYSQGNKVPTPPTRFHLESSSIFPPFLFFFLSSISNHTLSSFFQTLSPGKVQPRGEGSHLSTHGKQILFYHVLKILGPLHAHHETKVPGQEMPRRPKVLPRAQHPAIITGVLLRKKYATVCPQLKG